MNREMVRSLHAESATVASLPARSPESTASAFHALAEEMHEVRSRLCSHGALGRLSLFESKPSSWRYEDEAQDRAALIDASLKAYGLVVQALKGLCVFEGRVVYPCIGGDSVPSAFAEVIGVTHPGYQSIQGGNEAAARARIERAVGPRSEERIALDLDSPGALRNLSGALEQREPAPQCLLLKNCSEYLSVDALKEIVVTFTATTVRPLNIILVNTDVRLADTILPSAIDEIRLPRELLEMQGSFESSFLGCYLENSTNLGEEFDDEVLFHFPLNLRAFTLA